MYTLRRWWDRHGFQFALVGLVLSAAWVVRQTQGAAVYEIYRAIAQPFGAMPTQEERLENARILELQQRLVELESQNQNFKELLGYVKASKNTEIVAPIVGRGTDEWWQQLTLGVGENKGIKPNYIVAAPGGLVGRVIGVTPTTSKVLLISDPSSKIGVTISRTRFMGVLRGQTANRAVMEFFDKVPDVQRGDVVSTSSYSDLFPAGIPVGRVESVNLHKSPAPEAVIELSAPIHYLEWVVVYPNKSVE